MSVTLSLSYWDYFQMKFHKPLGWSELDKLGVSSTKKKKKKKQKHIVEYTHTYFFIEDSFFFLS